MRLGRVPRHPEMVRSARYHHHFRQAFARHCGTIGRHSTMQAVNIMADEPDFPPTISFDGARLRPLRADDADAVFSYLKHPGVTELTSYPIVSLSMVRAMIDRCQQRWRAGEWSKWGIALERSDQIVGMCGFNESAPWHRWAELGYDLAQPHWGEGLMSRSVGALLRWVFEQDRLDRVHAFVRVDNERSARLLERLGFLQEGRLRNYRICQGTPYDFHVYGLLRSDWNAKQSSMERKKPKEL